ncbi:hypothetical protein JMA_27770 [Jeotgalibacillus malaysiensis]|uniref:Uncharacterized protein n=1 Tax=Jeotgalibacillus malaysiensis TaxID=1508404 RepID=A0A0B5AVQ6_9BACL|nr:hypothetical protein [Jeotgalibacillus malaysiensis]AJD92094.1 hypothetical protein JMA_27770 [Jeotgalibacillus malaysiensis]
METFINRIMWFGFSTVGAAFLGTGVLFVVLALFTQSTDIMGLFKWILLIFNWGVGGISLLISIAILAIGLKLRFSSGKQNPEVSNAN